MKENKKTSKWMMVLLIIIASIFTFAPFIIFGLALFFESNTKYEINDNGTISINKNSLTISSDIKGYYDEKNDVYYIEGYLKNNKNKEFGYADITYIVYDKDNNILGEATASISKIQKNGTWKFKAIYSENDAAEVKDFKISDIQIYD